MDIGLFFILLLLGLTFLILGIYKKSLLLGYGAVFFLLLCGFNLWDTGATLPNGKNVTNTFSLNTSNSLVTGNQTSIQTITYRTVKDSYTGGFGLLLTVFAVMLFVVVTWDAAV